MTHTLSLSTGNHLDLPLSQIKQIEERMRSLQIRLSVQKKFGSNWKKTRLRLAKLYRRIRRMKEDFIQKQTSLLVKAYGGIAVEDLKVKNMTASAKGTLEEPGKNVAQKAGLNRAILRSSPGRIYQVLKYKCQWNKRWFVAVAPRNTSRECRQCEFI